MAKIGHVSWAISHAKCSVWVKNEKFAKVRKTIVRPQENFNSKKPLQKTPKIEKMTVSENSQNWQRCMGYSPMQNTQFGSKLQNAKNVRKVKNAKNVRKVKIQKWQKGAKNDCTTTLALLCAKNRSKKRLIFEK